MSFVLAVSLPTSGCLESFRWEERPASEVVMIDTSGSMPSEVKRRIHVEVIRRAQEWTSTARAGDDFAIWWFADGGEFVAEHASATMPIVQPPASLNRGAAVARILEDVEACLGRLPENIKQTPLLEALRLLSLVQDQAYRLTLFTDLQQESPLLDAIASLDAGGDTVGAMLEIAPPPRKSPVSVSLVTWPGRTRGHVAVVQHAKLRELFTEFFGTWAPHAPVQVVSIH